MTSRGSPVHQTIFKEALNKNALIVLGKGLGTKQVLASFMKLFCNKKSLVFVLSCDKIAPQLIYMLRKLNVPDEDLPRVLSNVTLSNERAKLYAAGGCFILTSRVLILDLLQKRVQPSCISGFFIYDAHRVTELSIEAFIIRLYRRGNQDGFVKGFTENAPALSRGFGRTQKILHCLSVEKMFLWPRFHKDMITSFKDNPPEVVELAQPLTDSMEKIQSGIVKVMQMCLRHLGRIAKIDVSECTVAKGLLQSFDHFLMERLNPQWSLVDYKSKQMIQDLKILRRLLLCLINYDAVTFHRMLDAVRQTASQKLEEGSGIYRKEPSQWLMTDAADAIFKYAKIRVFKIRKKNKSKKIKSKKRKRQKTLTGDVIIDGEDRTSDDDVIPRDIRVPTLEENPKWQLLKEVIDEAVTLTKQVHNEKYRNSKIIPKQPTPIFIITNDDRGCREVLNYLKKGGKHYMKQKYDFYMNDKSSNSNSSNNYSNNVTKNDGNKADVNKFVTSIIGAKEMRRKTIIENEKKQEQRKRQNTTSKQPSLTSNSDSNDNTAIQHQLQGDENNINVIDLINEEEADGEDASGNTNNSLHADDGQTLFMKKKKSHHISKKSNLSSSSNNRNRFRSTQQYQTTQEWWEAECRVNESMKIEEKTGIGIVELVENPVMVIPTFQESIDLITVLEETQPSYIILYDPTPYAIRAIEVYACKYPQLSVRVYFLIYEGSIEEQRYLAAIKEEKDAFLKLIDIKSHSVVRQDLETNNKYSNSSYTTTTTTTTMNSRNSLGNLDFTRKGGNTSSSSNNMKNKNTGPRPNQVICDVREFRSALPSMLDLRGLTIVPVTLSVGDYILTPDLVVERKSLSDLFSSFASGRLVTQVESMSRHFRLPSLLIEFSEDRDFRLIPKGLPSDIRVSHIISRIVLLTLNFPRLRIMWMRSPYATAKMFEMLKEKEDEPDIPGISCAGIETADNGGTNSNATGVDQNALLTNSSAMASATNYVFNIVDNKLTPQDMMLRVPGVTATNIHPIIKKAPTLLRLSLLSEMDLKPIVGQANARSIVQFFNSDVLM